MNRHRMELHGTVTTGLGRGARYVGMDAYQQAFNDALGYEPFPGTLNLVVDPDAKRAVTRRVDPVRITAPVVDGNRLSAVNAYRLNFSEQVVALIEMEITDHPESIAEFIAPVKLRDAYNLDDGDRIVLRP